LMNKYKKAGLTLENSPVNKENLPFNGEKFVLTGSLEKYSRTETGRLIRDMGGEISSSVSKNTDYVVAGKEPGSKLEKAKKLGIKILSEKEFVSFINISAETNDQEESSQ